MTTAQATSEIAAAHFCQPVDYVDRRDSRKWPGLIRTTCRQCGKFLGYRKIEPESNEPLRFDKRRRKRVASGAAGG